jgi:hypothetical protein
MKPLDITGQKFGRLTAIKYEGVDNHHRRIWLYKCECGNEVIKPSSEVVRGITKSCGCLKKDNINKYRRITKKHGKTGTRLYAIWCGIKCRCNYHNYEKKYRSYKNVEICDEWREFEPFCEWAETHGYRDDLTIDRINNNGNYEPNNCRWVDYKTQENNKSTNHRITYNGVTKNLTEWMAYFGKKDCSHYYYYHRKGVSDSDIIDYFMKKKGESK